MIFKVLVKNQENIIINDDKVLFTLQIGLNTPILRAIIRTNHVLLLTELTNICINNNN